MGKRLTEILKRAESWPEADQDEAAELLLEIEAERNVLLPLDDADLAALERSAADVREGRFATDEEVRAILSRYRR
ncbi:MAG TPA: hypothetical protein PKA74_14105 [Bauldia sp.]|nr:hypothetical protein [Bauldia sp.]